MIRIGTFRDIPNIISNLYSFYNTNEGYYSNYEPNETYVYNSLSLIIQNPHVDILVEDTHKGFAIIEFGPEWYTDRMIATEKFVFVHPDHRQGSTFLRLVRGMEQWARSRQAYALWVGVSTNEQTDRIAHAYQRMGYFPAGRQFVKILT
jgi:GNAT superfamily N-acetyltransferase